MGSNFFLLCVSLAVFTVLTNDVVVVEGGACSALGKRTEHRRR